MPSEVHSVIANAKRTKGFFLEIRRPGSAVAIGRMEPLGPTAAESDEIVESLTRWRNVFVQYFLTQFEARPETTRKWLSSTVAAEDSRILFLIRTSEGKMVGHIGACNITADSAQLDNIVRGEAGGGAGLMSLAEVTLIEWLFNAVGVRSVFVEQLSNNRDAMVFHERVGFRVTGVCRLVPVVSPGMTRYEIRREARPLPGEFGYMRMDLDREQFLAGLLRDRHGAGPTSSE